MSLLDHIEFSDLRIFVTILRTGSFKAAAIQLGLTRRPPAMP
jgi:DNA-binding transcriptional LysR family regulator